VNTSTKHAGMDKRRKPEFKRRKSEINSNTFLMTKSTDEYHKAEVQLLVMSYTTYSYAQSGKKQKRKKNQKCFK